MRRIKHEFPYVAVGLDLSLTGAGVCILPPDWTPGDWNVKTAVFGQSLPKDATEEQQTERLAYVSDAISNFITNEANARSSAHVRCFIEQYAFNMAHASRAHRLGEIGGVVKLTLRDCNYGFNAVTASTARKFLLGKLPRADQKKLTIAALKSAGANFGKEDDRYDAFTLANFGRAELGLPALTLAG